MGRLWCYDYMVWLTPEVQDQLCISFQFCVPSHPMQQRPLKKNLLKLFVPKVVAEILAVDLIARVDLQIQLYTIRDTIVS